MSDCVVGQNVLMYLIKQTHSKATSQATSQLSQSPSHFSVVNRVNMAFERPSLSCTYWMSGWWWNAFSSEFDLVNQ